MHPNHERTIARLVTHFQADDRFLALLIGGSVAKGWASPTADVDIMLLATDEEYAHRLQTGELLYFERDFCDYPDGYVDGKIIDRAFLEEVATLGSETARSAFLGVKIAYSHIEDLAPLLARITAYPEAEREAKMKTFYSQIVVHKWYLEEAEKKQNRYLLMYAATGVALMTARLLLAYNRRLYPFHKWVMQALQESPDKPAPIMTLLDDLLADPSFARGEAILNCLDDFRDWGVSFQESMQRFMHETEWNWRGGHPPLWDA